MKIFNIIAISKIKKSLNEFASFMNKNLRVNFNLVNKNLNKKNKKKVITLLKSPHVNKNAQEQFEIEQFGLSLNVKTIKPFNFLMFLKKIKVSTFPAVKIKVKNLNINNRRKITDKKNLNLNNYYIKTYAVLCKELIKLTADSKRKELYLDTIKKITTCKEKMDSSRYYKRVKTKILCVRETTLCTKRSLKLIKIEKIVNARSLKIKRKSLVYSQYIKSLRRKSLAYALLKTFDNFGQ